MTALETCMEIYIAFAVFNIPFLTKIIKHSSQPAIHPTIYTLQETKVARPVGIV